jgi:hypothetical protein
LNDAQCRLDFDDKIFCRNNQCETCKTDQECVDATNGDMKVCAPSLGDGSINLCQECSSDDHCPDHRPACFEQTCVECNTALDCPAEFGPYNCEGHQCIPCGSGTPCDA